MAQLDVRPNHQGPGDQYSNAIDEGLARNELATTERDHPLDSEEARKEHRKLLEWFFHEKDRQADNRLEMAMDADFYDNIQWDPTDAQVLRDRGQMPLVFNEVAPMVDWVIGTERRTRVDWRVMPRTEDDVEMADTKTKVLKYVSDINRCQFVRSRAFGDAIKVGVGWLDDGVRDDPTQDILYSKYEDWRNVLWDSAGYELDLTDSRYMFRWRWVDEDVAVMMFPDRANCIREGVQDAALSMLDGMEEDAWYSPHDLEAQAKGVLYARGSGGMMIDAKRNRVRLIECQYRKPVTTKVVTSGPLRGAIFDPRDLAMAHNLAKGSCSIVDKVMMRMHVAVFTEAHMLAMGPAIYRHNKFSLTPVWCYRRGRDRLPYGSIRRVRDLQQDLNKRASKALFMLNTNQVIADENAVDDIEATRDEVSRPDGFIVKKSGKNLEIRRDTDGATGQLQMMTMDAQSIQKSGGVSDENLGRQTNAVSGEAIKARQLQGSVVTTEPFDNLRLATQIQGEKQLSLAEQFYTDEKVIRLTGAKGALEWVRINVPELQSDGSVRFINDMTSSMADFIVSEQDYAGTLRQVMFESLNQIAGRLPPEIALRLMTIAMEFSDLPNKDEIANEIRKMTGERDPNKPMTPEEQQQAQQQAAMQTEALEIQRQTALATLEEQRAKVRELNARALKLEAEAGGADQGSQVALNQLRMDMADEVDRLSEALRKAQADLANRTMQIRTDADTKLEAARIDGDYRLRVAEIQAESNEKIAGIEAKLDAVLRMIEAKAQGKADKKTT